METGRVLKLDCGLEYVIIDKVSYEGEDYYFAVGFTNQNMIFDDNFFFKLDTDGGILELEDEELYKTLFEQLTQSVFDEVDPEYIDALIQELDEKEKQEN